MTARCHARGRDYPPALSLTISTEISTAGIVPRFSSPSAERVSILGPADPRPVVRFATVAMVGDRSLQDEDDPRSAPMVVDRAEDASRLDGHHPHPKLVPGHALDLAIEIDHREFLHRDTPGLGCHLPVVHRTLLSVDLSQENPQ